MIQVSPVILCGGSGTRLWPLSRAGFPKQFIALSGKHSLYQLAAQRLHALSSEKLSIGECLIVTGEEHRFMALEQLREMQLHSATLLLEPSARNTAAALTLAALQAVQDGADPVLVASPSDQHIGDEAAYTACVRQAIEKASSGTVVILGIKPTCPETGYGYIRYAREAANGGARPVEQFVEKPTAEVAEQYLNSGDYAWNSGMFVLKASVWLQALGQFRPDIFQACHHAWDNRQSEYIPFNDSKSQAVHYQFIRPEATGFSQVPSESVDYAVMEKCPGSIFPIHMVELDAGWSDLGAWDAVWQVGQGDAQGNVCQGDVLLDGASGNFIHASSRLVGAVGVKDLVIVETADAVLVSSKAGSQNVKKIVAQLQKAGRSEQTLHRKVHRPWGWYDDLDVGEHFKVKRVSIKPGASLSKQTHSRRAEHWIVVKGSATLTCGSSTIVLRENQSTFVPQNQVHQLANNGTEELEVIEVQFGESFDENEIVRLKSN